MDIEECCLYILYCTLVLDTLRDTLIVGLLLNRVAKRWAQVTRVATPRVQCRPDPCPEAGLVLSVDDACVNVSFFGGPTAITGLYI